MSGSFKFATGALAARLRHHDQADQDRRRRSQHRGDHEMRGGIGDQRRQQRGVEHQHGAGDPGHAAGHHQKQFATRQLRQIRADEQWRFHHAEKYIGGGGKSDRAADPKRTLQQPCHAAHDRRQDAPVEQQRGQHAHHQHYGERLKRQDEIGSGRLEVERQRAAAEIAEHEGSACARGGGDGADGIVDDGKGVRDERQFDQRERGEEGDGKADCGLSQRNSATVLADRPGDREQRQHAERRLQLLHPAPPPSSRRTPGPITTGLRDWADTGKKDLRQRLAPLLRRRLWVPAFAGTTEPHPRPTNGILLAITVMNSTLASSGRLAM